MVSSVSGRNARRIATGLYSISILLKGETRVFWNNLAEDLTPGVFTTSENAAEISALENITLTDTAPIEWNGRFYWLQNPPAPQTMSLPPAASAPPTLTSARIDGTDRREHLTLSLPRRLEWLRGHRSRLYCATLEGTNTSGNAARSILRLNRVHPERANPAEILEPLVTLRPGVFYSGMFEGDYYYYVAQELKENWLDWSSNGLYARPVKVLYRCRLPN
jgi:hypothetical protein